MGIPPNSREETGGLRLDKNGLGRALWEPTAPPPPPHGSLKIACPISTPGTQSTTRRSPHLRGCPPGTWSCVWSWAENQAHRGIWHEGCRQLGCCVARRWWCLQMCRAMCRGLGRRHVMRRTQRNRSPRDPGKPDPHLTLPDPHVSLPQSPASP